MPATDRTTHESYVGAWWLPLLTPLAFVLAPLVSFYATNSHELKPSEMLPVIGIGLLAVAAATAILFAITRRVAATALFMSLCAATFFYYGHVYTLVAGIKIDLGVVRLGPNRFLAVVLILGVLPILAFLTRRPARATIAAKTLAVIGVSLMITSAAAAVSAQPSPAGAEQVPSSTPAGIEPWAVPSQIPGAESLPDIYYVVLDAYASNPSLMEVAGYDNSAFTDHLDDMGFFVAQDSKSNYTTTFLSLAATLNMEYISDDVFATIRGQDRTVPYEMIRGNRTVKTLKDSGYTYTHITSGWGATKTAPMADVVLEAGVSELEAGIKDTTMLRILADRSMTEKKHRAVRRAFSHLRRIKQEEQPKFVFAHVIAPHGPYVFRANGDLGDGSSADMTNWNPQQIDDYVEQLQAINAMTQRFVDDLIENHERPLIVIIQGDHGTGFRSPSPTNSRELSYVRRHSILNAVYYSEGRPKALYPSISSVNTFRVVLNEALGTDYPLLEDRSFASASYDDPYSITDVTEIVRSAIPE